MESDRESKQLLETKNEEIIQLRLKIEKETI